MDGDGDRWGADVPTDVFGEILKLLPPISGRRRLRLVCRRWRDVVDEMEPEMMQKMSPFKPLAFFQNGRYSGEMTSAFVLNDQPESCAGRCIFRVYDLEGGHHMVGTCNGIVLLAHCRYVGDHTLVLHNPATGDSLDVQPPPKARHVVEPPDTLTFGYHPTTGKYKIVHFPVTNWKRTFAVVEVLTLGDPASWREVPAPAGSTCYLPWGIVSVDGVTYWVAKDGRIMSLDLENESIAEVKQLPAMTAVHNVSSPVLATTAVDKGSCQLTEVGGRLGVAIATRHHKTTSLEVWVLNGRGDKQSWSRWCCIQELQHNQKIGQPCFAYAKYVLTNVHQQVHIHKNNIMYMYLPLHAEDGSILMRFNEKTDAEMATSKTIFGPRMFAHLETSEPLDIYKKNVNA